MVEYVIDNGYEPVWECGSKSVASRSVTEGVGFEITDSFTVFGKCNT